VRFPYPCLVVQELALFGFDLDSERNAIHGVGPWWAPVIQAWQISKPRDFPNYEVGGWVPKAADDFLHRDGRRCREVLAFI
jgi:glucose-6-phosphate 1-dehydrogenase